MSSIKWKERSIILNFLHTIFYYHSWFDLLIFKIMRNMLISNHGPQGSGNHLWSKILSLHPKVYGWKSLLDNYWEAHRFSEPFCEYWKDPSKLSEFNWKQSEFYFTSISVPLGIKEKVGTKYFRI